MEEWRTIHGFPRHRVSNEGRVRMGTGRIVRPYYHSDGTKMIRLYTTSVNPRSVALLVANAFIPNPTNATRVDFIDGDKTNCRVDNLKWHENVSKKRKGER